MGGFIFKMFCYGTLFGMGFLFGRKKYYDEEEEEFFWENKNITLQYENKEAEEVAVAGDFNNWDTTADKMVNLGDGNWTITLNLKPGRFEYKFVIDGTKWIADPQAKEFVDDGYGGQRSVLVVD
ncbi:MAG: isoamylase early set domain-containing protein [bacterium]|nr:isoamylase early set domain-containing protein [bacterium]